MAKIRAGDLQVRLRELGGRAGGGLGGGEGGSPRLGSKELDAACAMLVRELDVDEHGMLSLQGLNAAIKRFHDTMNETKTRVHEVTCRWSELRRAAMEAQRAVRGYVGKDATTGAGVGTADEEAVQRVRREAQLQAEAKAQQEAALELERKARRERDKKAISKEERDRERHPVQTAPSPAPGAPGPPAAAGQGSRSATPPPVRVR